MFIRASYNPHVHRTCSMMLQIKNYHCLESKFFSSLRSLEFFFNKWKLFLFGKKMKLDMIFAIVFIKLTIKYNLLNHLIRAKTNCHLRLQLYMVKTLISKDVLFCSEAQWRQKRHRRKQQSSCAHVAPSPLRGVSF